MRNHIIDGLTALAEKDPRIVLMTADLGFGVLEGFQKKYPQRYVNCGIAEQNMASAAAGMALEGDMVFMYSIGNFPTLRCLEQIRNNICYHNANVKILAVGGGFSYGSLGMTHHSTEDISIMRALPNMRVYAPADPNEAEKVLQEIHDISGPCYVRLARGGDPILYESRISDLSAPIEIVHGTEVALLAAGTILSEAQKAAAELSTMGISTAVYSCPRVKPLSADSIATISESVKLLITVEENQLAGGFGAAILEKMFDAQATTKVIRIGLDDTFTSVVGNQEYLRKYYQVDSTAIVKRAVEELRKIK